MNIDLANELSYKDPLIQAFFLNPDPAVTGLDQVLTPPAGFSKEDVRMEAAYHERESIEFPMIERWSIVQAGTALTYVKVFVTRIQDLVITCGAELFLQNGIPDPARAKARALFQAYDPAADGPDIEAWVRASLSDGLTEAMFSIKAKWHLEKERPLRDGKTAQRDAMKALYEGKQGSGIHSDIPVVGDLPVQKWAEDSQVTLEKVSEDIMTEPYVDPQASVSHEVPAGKTPDDVVDGIVDEVLSKIVPVSCGDMREERFKLLTIVKWPEFKFTPSTRTIEIGCFTVVIPWVDVEVRTAEISIYAYYALPRDVARTVWKIAEACALRAALGGAVVGIVAMNPAPAAAAFELLFTRCLEREVPKCIHAGLLKLQESGPWKPL